MKKYISIIASLLSLILLLSSLTLSLGSCMIFGGEDGSDTSSDAEGGTDASEGSEDDKDEELKNARYRFWTSGVSESAIEIDTETDAAKFYSLKTGYYTYYAVDETTYQFDGDELVLHLGSKDYTFIYDDDENTLTIENSDAEADDIVYTAMESAPELHPTYSFPDFESLSFDAMEIEDYKLSEIRKFAMEEARIKIAIDYYEDSLTGIPTLENKKVERGDYINIDYIGYMDGVIMPNSGDDDHPLAVIQHPENVDGITYPKEFIDGMIGHSVGDEFEITIVYPEGHEYAGKEAVYKVVLNSVYDIELTLQQIENYETAIFESYDAYVIYKARNIASHLAIPYLIKETGATAQVPKAAYEFFHQAILDDYHFVAHRDYKMDFEKYLTIVGQTEERILEQAKGEAADFLMAYYIAEENNLKWTTEQYTNVYEETIAALKNSGYSEDEAVEMIQKPEQQVIIQADLTYQIAAEWLAEKTFEN